MSSEFLFLEDNRRDRRNRQTTLNDAGVWTEYYTTTAPRTIDGVAFRRADKYRVLRVLGLENILFTEQATNNPRVRLLESQGRIAGGLNFVIDPEEVGFPPGYWDQMVLDICVWFQQTLSVRPMSVVIHFRESEFESVALEENTLHLFLVPGSEGRETVFIPGQAHITKLPDDDPMSHHIYREHVLRITSAIEENLDILLLSGDEAAAFMRKWTEEKRKRAEEVLKRSREEYIQGCSRRYTNTIRATERGIREAEATVQNAMRQITEAVRKQSGLQQKLGQLVEGKERFMEQLGQEFDKLLATEGITNVTVNDGAVSIFTEHIEIPFERNVYDIGKFRIDIGHDGGIHALNLTRRIDSFDHPHIHRGICCLGNLSDGIAQLLGEYQYAVLADVMLQFLKEVNEHGWHIPIVEWPFVAERSS